MRKKIVKSISSILLFCIICGSVGKLTRYLVTDDTNSYTRITFHEMYEQKNIDILFVGSSHCYRSFNPEILDAELGMNTFNAGSSQQSIDGSYMLIKEAAKYNDLKHIYLEVYYDVAKETRNNRTDLTSTYIISDYLRPSFDKYNYLLKASSPDYYGNSFFVARRNSIELLDLDYINTIVSKKSDDVYKNYAYDNVTFEKEWYCGKGFVFSSGAVDNWDFFSYNAWPEYSADNICEDWVNELDKIIDFCNRKGIELTLVSAPMSNYLLSGIKNYDEYVAYVNELAKDKNVDYLDFNLCKTEYFPNDCQLFNDADHMNGLGAELFSYLFADVVTGKLKMEDITYNSYQEKLDSIEPMIFGVAYYNHVNEEGIFDARYCKIVTNAENKMEFCVTYEQSDGNVYVVKDYTSDIYFQITPETTGRFIIDYKFIADEDTAGSTEITVY